MIPAAIHEIPLEIIISESILGNAKMQELLYRQFAPAMYKQCLQYAKNTLDAEDLLQESFIKIFRHLDKFRGDGSFEGWLKKIIFHTAVSHFRSIDKKIHQHQTELSHCIEDKEASIFDHMAQKDIVKIVTTLPSGYRTVFIMYVIEGYNHKEIAGILGCSEGTCKSQLSRTKTQLRKILAPSS